jgi:HSP20 family molecular chaperone IbpA
MSSPTRGHLVVVCIGYHCDTMLTDASYAGHFERRVSFGYDADLSQVRAEFDGDALRVTIPRRISPVTWSSGV